jgi:shikimate kinase
MALRVLLIGLMGTGKSTVGRRLAEHLGARFVDNDELVAAATGVERDDLLKAQGEAALRAAESAALIRALREPTPVVAAVAAGVVLDPGDRAALRSGDAVVIWLRARPETLAARTAEDRARSPRPWLEGDPVAVFTAMSRERAGWYGEVADLTVDVDDLSPDDAVARILPRLPPAEPPRNPEGSPPRP